MAGEALSLLVIARLPFSVPSDPVYMARSELYEDPFQEYALPQAVIRFKQGFGRLIRRKTDRGVVVVMDRRLRSKTYGASFVRSIPSLHLARPATARAACRHGCLVGRDSLTLTLLKAPLPLELPVPKEFLQRTCTGDCRVIACPHAALPGRDLARGLCQRGKGTR